ncbi:Cell division inhibitor [Salmonella enterica subsp. arizonae]|uniref:Cell division inhibitor n=1 Tax=Salmonella enterica subsp. arizonae TaxID=59203 RepID=A0A2X4TQZ0_SALER|nr:Cell division inhibitor [Salmonella enterica subsp. arizonae]
MQILITGGTGLIGRHLIPRLLTLGHQVTVVTRNPYNARQIFDSRVALWKGLAEREHLNEIDASSIWLANRLPTNAGRRSKKNGCAKVAGLSRKSWWI